MQFGYTILYVDDVAATLDFYRRAFGVETRMLHESGDFGELETGATALAFSSRRLMTELGKKPGRPVPNQPCFEIAFTTDDVDAALSRAKEAGGEVAQEPEHMPWGQTVAYVVDLNGFLVELCTPVAT